MAWILRAWDPQSDIDSETSFFDFGNVKAIPPGASSARDPRCCGRCGEKESCREIVEQDAIDHGTRATRSDTTSM